MKKGINCIAWENKQCITLYKKCGLTLEKIRRIYRRIYDTDIYITEYIYEGYGHTNIVKKIEFLYH
jgi:RimJ/RimL family protein N-acetyltransferase